MAARQSFIPKDAISPIGSILEVPSNMVGRITEEHLSEAEKTFPGIIEIYEGLDAKPMTFLQLVWIYEVALKG